MSKFTETALKRLAGLEPFPQPSLICLRYPVMLMHGFGMLASFRRGGHLHDEAMYMRHHGVLAYAPNVSPYETVPVRAAMWQQRIEGILEESGADKVNLIAHSMGGLDARYLISRLGLHTNVASLITISTPHCGSAIADIVLEQPERIRDWLTDLANWISITAMEKGSANFRKAVEELRPAHMCETFNPAVSDHPSVRYWSYAGQAGKGTSIPINPLLRLLNTMLHSRQGINDGFVAVESAQWGTFLGTQDADHAQQVGVEFPLGSRFRSKDFYLGLVRMLEEEAY